MILLEVYLMGLLTTFVFVLFKLTSHRRWIAIQSDQVGVFGMGVVNLFASAVSSVGWPITIWTMLTRFDKLVDDACDAVEKGE